MLRVLILVSIGRKRRTVAAGDRSLGTQPNTYTLPRMNMIGPFVPELRRILLYNISLRRVADIRAPRYIANGKPHRIQSPPGLNIRQTDQIRHREFLTPDTASQHQRNGASFLDTRPGLDRLTLILLIQHRIPGKVRLKDGISHIQSILPQYI